MAQSTPLLEFQVLTDTHLTGDAEHGYNRNFAGALADIAAIAPHSRLIVHAGDITDRGLPGEYAELERILREGAARHRLPEIKFVTGNHDMGLGSGDWDTHINRFKAATGMPAPYSDCWIEGYHFVFAGTEQALELHCSLSERQLHWLDVTLKERASSSDPVFLFLHQPLKNTVAGSYEEQQWHGVAEDEALRTMLSAHRHVILFTGHTHWELASPNNAYGGGDRLPAMFNAASVAYLWNNRNEEMEGSELLYVEVYRNKLVIKGRDAKAGRWIAEARYELHLHG